MYKKPYYKKYKKRRTNYKKKYYNNTYEYDSDKLIVIGLVFIFFMFFGIYKNFIEPNLGEIIFLLKILIPFILITGIGISYYIYKNNKKVKLENIKNTPGFLLDLEKNIKLFKPLEKWNKEEHFQNGLTGFLSGKYDSIDIEETRDYSRPDIVINNTIVGDIALELKGPTNMQGLTSLPDKINKYIPKWDYLYIVLFDIDIVKYKNVKENIEIYNQKKNEILINIPEEKKDKVIFIEMGFKRK